MIVRTGLDMMDVARIEKALAKPHFRERVFFAGENARIDAKGAQTAAGLYAAKEAIAKALGTGFTGFGPWDIEIVHDAQNAPMCVLYRGAEKVHRELGGGRIHISITHLPQIATAIAILTDECEESA